MTQEQIITALGLDGAPEEMKKTIVGQVATLAEKRLVLLLDELLTDEQRAHFEKLEASDDKDAAGDWFLKEFPQLQEIYEAIVQDVIAEQQERLKRIRGSRTE